jgi:hypothetical protein
MESEHISLVRVGQTEDGLVTYLVELPLEELPAVRGRDLEAAWDAARSAAISGRFGLPRGFRFRRQDGSVTDLALADRDARCWAGAVDGTIGMHNSYGLSLCLRLLALVELLARVAWATRFFRFGRDGACLDPSLLRTAASLPLTAEARFDEQHFLHQLATHLSLDRPFERPRLTGASA